MNNAHDEDDDDDNSDGDGGGDDTVLPLFFGKHSACRFNTVVGIQARFQLQIIYIMNLLVISD